MKTLYAAIAGMALLAGLAFGLPSFLPQHRPEGVSPELISRLKTQAMVGFNKPAFWWDVKAAHVAPDTSAGVAGTIRLRTLFGVHWAEITVLDDGNHDYEYHDRRQWEAIIVFVAGELILGAIVVWRVMA